LECGGSTPPLTGRLDGPRVRPSTARRLKATRQAASSKAVSSHRTPY